MRRVLLPTSTFTARQLAGNDPIVNGSGCITWHSTIETTGSATAEYKLYDEGISSDQELMHVTLSAGQSTRDYIGLHSLPFIGGLFLEVVSGSIDGSFSCYVDHLCERYLHTEHEFYRLIDAVTIAALVGTAQ